MDRNTIIGLVLIAAIFVGYFVWMTPSQEELLEKRRIQDSIAEVQRIKDSIRIVEELKREEQIKQQQVIEEEQATVAAAEVTEQDAEALQEKYGIFSGAAAGDEEVYTVETDIYKIGVSTRGGKIVYVELKNYKTWDSLPLILIDSDTAVFGFTFLAGTRSFNTNNFYFEPMINGGSPGRKEVKISGEQGLDLGMRIYTTDDQGNRNTNRYIEYLYSFAGNKYMLDYTVNFVGMQGVIDDLRGSIDFEWSANLRQQEKSIDRFNGSTVYYKIYDDKVDYLSETKDDEERLRDRIKWVSFKQHFFSSTLISESFFEDPIFRTVTVENPPSDRYLKSTYMKVAVPFQATDRYTMNMDFYFGPNKYNVLRKYKLDLERQLPLGWSFFLIQWINRYAVIPVFNFLGSFGWNYGIVILVLTILLKIVLFPITYKTYMSSARMRVLKPEIDELNKKFPKKEDSMKKQQATMSLYKRAGVNPMSGCFPVLLQLPILIAMFRFFPASIELRQESFLWATDLSTYDSILSLPFTIPFYGDHVSLFTLLMTVSTLIYTYMNNQMMATGAQQMPGMKTMMYIMPIMFLGIFNSYASGLSYYYFLVNIITFAQMFIFRKVVDEDKIYRKIQENKKKPVKKSSFQKRLEDAAKKRGYNPNQLKR